jgi:hypothetical protein
MTLEQKVIPARVGMLELARRLDNVSRARQYDSVRQRLAHREESDAG